MNLHKALHAMFCMGVACFVVGIGWTGAFMEANEFHSAYVKAAKATTFASLFLGMIVCIVSGVIVYD
jgi:hypothetical protein